jgi:hypothetical protein
MKKLFAALGISLGLLLGAAPASANIMLTFSPSSSHVNVGDSVVISVSISGLGAEVLSAFDFNVLYNGTILQWQVISVIPGCNALGAGSICGIDQVINGDIGFQGSSVLDDATLAATQPDSLLIAQINLSGLVDGVAILSLGPDLDFQRNFVGLDALSLQVDVGSACIAVGTGVCLQAPEPSSLALIGLALVVAYAALRRRRGKFAIV